MKLHFLLIIILLGATHSFAQEKKKGIERITEPNGYYREGKMKDGKKTGLWTYYDKNGVLLEETNYKEGLKNGEERKFDSHGFAYLTGTYKNNKKNGTWARVSSKGDTTKVETFRNDTLHGYYLETSYNISIRGYNVNGTMEGVWVKNIQLGGYMGEIVDSSTFKNGKLHGVRTTRFNGKLTGEQYYENGLQEGFEVTYHNNGTLKSTSFYKAGKRDSVYNEYSERDGSRARSAYYTNGEISRYDSSWNSNGSLDKVKVYTDGTRYYERKWMRGKVTSEGFYASEKMQDSAIYYNAKGKVIERDIYLDSFPPKSESHYTYTYRPFSTQYQYYENGKLHSVVKRRSSDRDGIYQEFDSTGFLSYSGAYVRGEKAGVWTRYNSKGAVLKTIEYERGWANGKYVAYYPNGKKKVSGKAISGYLQDSIRVWNKNAVEVKSGSVAYDTILENHFKSEHDLRFQKNHPEVTQDGDDGDMIVVAISDETTEDRAPQIFTFAEEMPKFPGDSLQSYLQHHIVFPAAEKEQGKSGTVYVSFIVNSDGTISHVTIAKGVPGAPGFSSEAIRVFSSMPKWIPGKMNGRAVDVQMTWPVRFVQ